MISVGSLLSLVAVSALWGVTNPLLKKSSVGIENIKENGRILQILAEVKFLIFNWKYVLAFVINQMGSGLYYWTLGSQDLSTVVIVCNSLTLVFTTLAAQMMGEQKENKLTYVGMLFVGVGVAICLASKQQQQK